MFKILNNEALTSEDLKAIQERAVLAADLPVTLVKITDVIKKDVPKLLAEVKRLREQFAHISDMASELYEVDSVKNEWIMRKSLEPHADFIDEIFIVSSEEAGLIGEDKTIE